MVQTSIIVYRTHITIAILIDRDDVDDEDDDDDDDDGDDDDDDDSDYEG